MLLALLTQSAAHLAVQCLADARGRAGRQTGGRGVVSGGGGGPAEAAAQDGEAASGAAELPLEAGDVATHGDAAVEEDEDDGIERGVGARDEREEPVELLGASERRVGEREQEERVPAEDEEEDEREEGADAAEGGAHRVAHGARVGIDAARHRHRGAHEGREAVRRVREDVPLECHEVVDGATDRKRNDRHPHGVDHVALERAVREHAVADRRVVVEVAADDGRAEVDDDAGEVDHRDAEADAAQAAADGRHARVLPAERVRLAADHREQVERRRRHDQHVGGAERGAQRRRRVAQQARRERNAVDALGDVERARVHDERAGEAARAQQDAREQHTVEDEAAAGDGEQVEGLM